jgi:hypothetical protein
MEETIFIQIAAYRDPELVPTVKDCIAKAAKPENLRICVGWQYAEGESINEIIDLPNVQIISVPHTQTRGACWIRRIIQDEYKNETYTLQLDSHHRFIQDWDKVLIDMLKGLKKQKVKKPLLTAYLPHYEPNTDPVGRVNQPWQLNFDRYLPEGPIFLKPSTLKNYETMTGPAPSRALSGHFIFTIGKFCKEVKYDPQLYFHGEEISLAIRAFTHGYDLYHPHIVVMWHQYTRSLAKRHWDDHKNWPELNNLSYKRVKILLGVDGEDPNQIDFKECGLGKVRTLYDYERYAGTEFKTRKMHPDVIKEQLPPIKYTTEEEFQKVLVCRFKHCIDVYKPDVPLDDYDFWCIVFKDKDSKDMYRQDADANEIKSFFASSKDNKFLHVWREFDSLEKPYKWTIWPHSKSKGWETKLLENIIHYP